MASQIEPFLLQVPDAVLLDLKQRLRATRWPVAFGTETWKYGARFDALQRIQTYWAEVYDWRTVETRINSYPQYQVEIDGLNVHFFHIPARSSDGRPLLLLHGWPGSQVEFIDLIEDLIDPSRFGRGADAAFDLVIPAIPGFGFGGKPSEPGWGPDRIAAAFHRLMTMLGYDRYAVQGGDWGAILGRRIAQNHGSALSGLHINMPYAYPPQGVEPSQEWRDFRNNGTAYLALQSTKPDAIAPGLSDSPMGLATWILEKFAAWSDGNGELPETVSLERLVTNLMFYWLPNSAASAARIYYESAAEDMLPFGGPRVTVPTGVAAFSKEPYSSPRSWVEGIYNVVRWRDFSDGGHFAALEAGTVLRDEIFAFFSGVE